MKIRGSVKNLKRLFYKGKATRFRGFIAIMVAAGLVASLCYFFSYVYTDYASAEAEVVLTYPEIALSRRPDGSRFTYYDFISDENIAAAIDRMKEEGKYKSYTVAQLRNAFSVTSDLEDSAGESVSTARSAGNDFSYVANEYRITFVQPHDYRNKSLIEKVFSKDYSQEFLRALTEVNRKRFSESIGGINGFRTLTDTTGAENYDYNEKLMVYKTKIDTIASYLNYLAGQSPDFVSHNDYTLKDIEGKYKFLISNRIDGISDFIESSGISKDISQASNKLRVNIEDNSLRYNKHADRSAINGYAMQNYDQTFTENLINVIQNETYGLYQARPKTAFDTVVRQKNKADESVAEYGANIQKYNRELTIFSNASQDPSEIGRLTAKCEEMMKGLEDEYNELTKLAESVVTEYYNDVNENYMTAKVKSMPLFTPTLLMRLGLVFVIGAVLAFILAVFISSISEYTKLRSKKKRIYNIKKTAVREAE